MNGLLHLLPVGLGPSSVIATHPPQVLETLNSLHYFIAEKAKSARAELKRLGYSHALIETQIEELPEQLNQSAIDALLAPLLAGADGGLMSEAGCPAVADPGALIVRRAHELGIRVIPHVGPSSLLMALMASGLNGQSFAFHGYLPIKSDERTKRIKQLEQESRQMQRTQLFIETPYRNTAMLQGLLETCEPMTRICVARSLTTSEEWIHTATVRDWCAMERKPDLDRQPTVFLLLAANTGKGHR